MASSAYSTPCAGCKFLRRKCAPECVFAPHFPPDQPEKFACVHKVFGASNVAKLLSAQDVANRDDTVTSLVYEANSRMDDPVYGCVRYIAALQQHLGQVQNDLRLAKNELASYPQQNPYPYPYQQQQVLVSSSSASAVSPSYRMASDSMMAGTAAAAELGLDRQRAAGTASPLIVLAPEQQQYLKQQFMAGSVDQSMMQSNEEQELLQSWQQMVAAGEREMCTQGVGVAQQLAVLSRKKELLESLTRRERGIERFGGGRIVAGGGGMVSVAEQPSGLVGFYQRSGNPSSVQARQEQQQERQEREEKLQQEWEMRHGVAQQLVAVARKNTLVESFKQQWQEAERFDGSGFDAATGAYWNQMGGGGGMVCVAEQPSDQEQQQEEKLQQEREMRQGVVQQLAAVARKKTLVESLKQQWQEAERFNSSGSGALWNQIGGAVAEEPSCFAWSSQPSGKPSSHSLEQQEEEKEEEREEDLQQRPLPQHQQQLRVHPGDESGSSRPGLEFTL